MHRISRKRFDKLDELRGIIFISMFCYHAMWDFVYLYGHHMGWYMSLPGYVWQQSICWAFILLSGFCHPFGKTKWRRGILIFLGGVLVSVVMALFSPSTPVYFGVLTFLGAASLFADALAPLLKRCMPVVGLIVCAFLFFLTRNINQGMLGFEGLAFFHLPGGLYQNMGTAFFGFPFPGFYSSDYFSFLPWIFLYLTGYFLCRLLLRRTDFSVLKKGYVLPLRFIGRHCLLLYLLHQPIIMAIFMLVS